MAALGRIDVDVTLSTLPSEVPQPIPFADDRTHDTYDPEQAQRFSGRPATPAPNAGVIWVHLRVCQECGRVGCCDSSPGQHATAHYHAVAHPVIRSFEPGEDWYFCYPDELVFELGDAPLAPSHP